MRTRRNVMIRTVATLCGDIAIGVAMASACAWLIEVAALGIFLSFLLWVLTAILALAFSQHVLHPAAHLLLSDRKLDGFLDASTGLVHLLGRLNTAAGQKTWGLVREQFRHWRTAPKPA